MTNVDTIRTLTRHEHEPLTRIVTPSLDYNKETNNGLMSAQEIESKIRSLMDDSNNIKKKTTCMKEMCLKALIAGGSSNSSIQRLIGDMIINIS